VTGLNQFERDGPLLAWRIIRADLADTSLSGQGGLYAAGRWHQAGRPVVYLSSAWSLAALEVLAHLGRRDSAIPFVYSGITIPPEVTTLVVDAKSLPADWRADPPLSETQALGSQWLHSRASAMLRVPSALSPAESEHNWVLNTMHPDAARLVGSAPMPFRFDRRMWKVKSRDETGQKLNSGK
jgi:RES domain-containing protein